MLDQLDSLFGPTWQTWLVPGCGGLAAVVLFALGLRLVGGRRGGASRGSGRADRVGAFLQPGEKRDRRRAERRKGFNTTVLVTNAAANAPPVPATVLDRSKGGIRLLVGQAMATTGMVLSVRPRTAPADVPWVRIEVRTAREENGDWLLGCKFVEDLPHDTLVLFG